MDTCAVKRGHVVSSLARIRTANAKIMSLSRNPSCPAVLAQQIALCRGLLRDLAIVRDRVRRPSQTHAIGLPLGTRRRRLVRRG